MPAWDTVAAANNAAWCAAVCRTFGFATFVDSDAWTSRVRTPPTYPDAVTLVPELDVPGLLARVDGSGGCSVKDSFASLDLTNAGFEVLFHAQWIVRSPSAVGRRATALRWDIVRD